MIDNGDVMVVTGTKDKKRFKAAQKELDLLVADAMRYLKMKTNKNAITKTRNKR